MGVKTKGFKELNKKFANMRKNLEPNVIKLKEKAIDVGYQEAISKVPVDSGELKGSIKKEEGKLVVEAEHGEAVEYGTFKTPAQPFIRPAYDEMKSYVEKNLGGVVDDS